MKTKILEQLRQRPMRVVTLCMKLGVEYREIDKHLRQLLKDGAIRFDKKAGWAMAQNRDEIALARADTAEARVRELEATDRIPADVEKRNTWAKRIVDERDAAQEAAGSAERRLRELEAEMKECSEVRAKLAVELAEYQLRQPAIEAQCAAMRGAMDEALKFVAVTPWTNKAPWTDDRLNGLFEAGQAALSGDAGRALLERVEALERVADIARNRDRPTDELGCAVSALDALEARQ